MTVGLLVQLRARLDAVLFSARGADGILGPDAQARAIPAGFLRKPVHLAPLDDENFPIEGFFRAAEVRWQSVRDEPEPTNPYHSQVLRRARFLVRVGYVYGLTNTGFVKAVVGSTETAASILAAPEEYALEDGERIATALGYPELVQGGTDPELKEVVREGETIWRDLGRGRAVSETNFRMRFVKSGVYAR